MNTSMAKILTISRIYNLNLIKSASDFQFKDICQTLIRTTSIKRMKKYLNLFLECEAIKKKLSSKNSLSISNQPKY